MNSIIEKIKATVREEEHKDSSNSNFNEFENLVKEMERLGLDNRPGYTLPQTDTIGRNYHSSLSRNIRFQ